MAQQFDYPKTETQLREIQDALYQHSKEVYEAGGRPAFKGLLEIMSAESTIITAIHVGFTALTFCRWERTPPKNQAETPYTDTGRQLYFERTKKKKMQARLDEMYSDRSARAISYGKWGKFNNSSLL